MAAMKFDVSDEARRAMVPSLLLQPLLENAIRHGIEPRARPGCIELQAHRQDGNLALLVSDDGAGLEENGRIKEGVGLSNTRARLRELYGTAHRFELLRGQAGGVRVELSIPFREEQEER